MYLSVGTFVFDGNSSIPISSPNPELTTSPAKYQVSLLWEGEDGNADITYGGVNVASVQGMYGVNEFSITPSIIAQAWNGHLYLEARQNYGCTASIVGVAREEFTEEELAELSPGTPQIFIVKGINFYTDNPPPVVSAEHTPWVINPSGGPEGQPCLQAGIISDNQTSSAKFIVAESGTLNLCCQVNSEGGYDFLTITKNENHNEPLFRDSGFGSWETLSLPVEAGDTLELWYTKDSSVGNGLDTAWVLLEFVSDGPPELQGIGTLLLSASGRLRIEGEANPVPIQGSSTLQFSAYAHLHKYRTLQAKATLKLQAQPLAANAIPGPSGLNALMKIITDPLNVETVLDQSLLVWFNGHPSQQRITLQIDNEPVFQPAYTVQNPGVTQGAVIHIAGAEIPGDGLIHQITVRVQQAVNGKTSQPSTVILFEKTPKPPLMEQAEWGQATVIRQGNGGTLSDLTRLEWRHDGAVKIIARYETRNDTTALLFTTQSTIGYVDHEHNALIIENLGEKVFIGGTSLKPITLGLCAIGLNEFGPTFWVNPVQIKQRPPPYAYATPEPLNPDIATAQHFREDSLMTMVTQAVRERLTGTPPANLATIISTSIAKLKLKIKDITRKGGSVALNDFGAFEARWNESLTTRSVAFVPSIGFKEGTRQGRILTDDPAKA